MDFVAFGVRRPLVGLPSTKKPSACAGGNGFGTNGSETVVHLLDLPGARPPACSRKIPSAGEMFALSRCLEKKND